MKRSTTNIIVYDNDMDDCDGHIKIKAMTINDAIGSRTDYTVEVGDTPLLLTHREFLELYKLMNEVINDGQGV